MTVKKVLPPSDPESNIGERAKVGPNAMVNANVKDGEEEW